MLKVPDIEIIHSVLDPLFPYPAVESGSYAREDEHGTVYLFSQTDQLLMHMPADVWLELLTETPEESTTNETTAPLQ